MHDIEERCLTRHAFHGEWNYTLLPGLERPEFRGGSIVTRPCDLVGLFPAVPV
jgi:hypothetical protein